jgi:hypothetical protein
MNRKITFLLLVYLSLSGFVQAQLSGAYTIGGTSPDYNTIDDALTAAQAGVSGPVIFNIRPGTYNGKIFLNEIQGASFTNTITFQSESGDSTSVILTDSSSASSSSDFTIFVNGADFINFNKVTIERSGTLTYRTVVFMGSNSRAFSITNCVVQASPYTFTTLNSSLVRQPVAQALDSLTTFRNNLFSGGSYGINLTGISASIRVKDVIIENNQFVDQGGQSISLTNALNAVVRNNNIMTTTTSTQYVGIHALTSIGTEVSGNKILAETGGEYGIFIETCAGTLGSPTLVSNNFVVCAGQFFLSGIEVDKSTYVNVYHNSVNIYSPTQGSYCIEVLGTGSGNVEILNNNFTNTGFHYAFQISPSPIGSVTLFDYNNLYAINGSAIGIYNNDTIVDIADLQTNHSVGLNSVSSNPQYISQTDLHAGSASVNDLGIPLVSVTVDIDGETRSGTSPDLGADEFTPLSDNVSILSMFSPSGGCGDSATMIGIVIKNLGLNNQTPFDIVADVIFPGGNQSITETTINNLPSNATDTFYFAQTINTYDGGVLDLTVYLDLAIDQYHFNDTVRDSYTFIGHPNAPTIVSPQDHCDNNLALTATADSGDVLMWYADETSDVLLYSGEIFSPSVSSDTTFWVETRNGSGSAGCLRISEVEPNGAADYIELQNVSGVGFDATGYKVVISDDYTDINAMNSITWDLDFFAPGEIKYRTDGTGDNYWGSNLLIEPGFPGWVMIVDPSGNVVDFVAIDWDSVSIQSLSITVDGNPVVVGSEWSGDGTPTTCATPGQTPNRIGNSDGNSAVDWACDVASKGTQNPMLATSFISCGVGACASPRFAIDVHLIPGVTASLGADTAAELPFNIPLSPGQGYTSYLWSTGATTDTIVVTSADTYWVTVSGANGCTITDTIVVGIAVGVNGQLSKDVLSFYPNPAKDQLTIKSGMLDLDKAQIRMFDSRGGMVSDLILNAENNRTYSIDLKSFEAGIYFVQVITDKGMRVERVSVVK